MHTKKKKYRERKEQKTPEIRIRSGHRTGAPRARRSFFFPLHCFTHIPEPEKSLSVPDQPGVQPTHFDTLLCGASPAPTSALECDAQSSAANNPNTTKFQLEIIIIV